MLNVHALEAQIHEAMNGTKVPGLALAIVHDWRLVYARGFGVTSVEDGGLAVTPRTLFRIGSVTKALTATAVMRLVDSGALALDRPIGEYLPWLRLSMDGAVERITLRMLLSHTSGLTTSYAWFGRRDPDGLELYVREDIPGYSFVATPGKLFFYSNPGFRLAGYIAQQIAGRPYVELMKDLVFEPLGMNRTTFDLTVAMTYPLAHSHDLRDDGTLSVQHRFGDNTGYYPSGACLSTVEDMAKFAIMEMSGGEVGDRSFLPAAAVREMQANQIDIYTTPGAGYGLGLFTDEYKGLRRAGHEGYVGTFGSRLMMVPEAGTAVILTFNRAGGFWQRAIGLVDRILDELLGLAPERPEPVGVEPDRSLWPLFTGSYVSDWRGLAEIWTEDGELMLGWNGEKLCLEAYSADHYYGQRADSDEIVGVGFILEGEEPLQYILIQDLPLRRTQPYPSFVPDHKRWGAYAGEYRGQTKAVVRVEGERLFVSAEGFPFHKELPCIPLSNTLFACDNGLVEFVVSDGGSVSAMRLFNLHTLVRAAGDA